MRAAAPHEQPARQAALSNSPLVVRVLPRAFEASLCVARTAVLSCVRVGCQEQELRPDAPVSGEPALGLDRFFASRAVAAACRAAAAPEHFVAVRLRVSFPDRAMLQLSLIHI